MHIFRPGPQSAATWAPQHSAQPARRAVRLSLRNSPAIVASLAALCGFAAALTAQAQDTFKPPPPVTYTEKYEVYGGLSFLNGKAGQSLPKDYNMGGGEVMATYWLTPRWGAAGDVRYEAGTTPVLPSAQSTSPRVQTRPLVSQFIGMGGAQYHLGGNQRVGVNVHALAGVSHGQFDHSNPGLDPGTFFNATGLYTNRTSLNAVVGGSLDFNRSARWAIRISPDFVVEKFGTDPRYFVSVSGGILYRFGNRK